MHTYICSELLQPRPPYYNGTFSYYDYPYSALSKLN